jgi:hypothetical protein
MEKVSVEDCPACDPVNKLVNNLFEQGFVIVEKQVEDYHFHQLYIKLQGNINLLNSFSAEGFSKMDNKYICDCHWTTVEIADNSSFLEMM